MREHDLLFLRKAYAVALDACGNSDPNPAVGAVIVDDKGEILAEGFTQLAGHEHAERMALAHSDHLDFSGATLYVTLEPCCHHGRTPPCTDIIIEKNIRRVVIGERDLAAEVQGRSVELLRARGIVVDIAPEAALQHEKYLTAGPFFFARQYGRPRVFLKWAQTLDGALAPRLASSSDSKVTHPEKPGLSRKISGENAAFVTAALRSYCKFVLTSPETSIADRPRLDIRFPEKSMPLDNVSFSPLFQQLLMAQYRTRHQEGRREFSFKSPTRGYLTAPLSTQVRAEILLAQQLIGGQFRLFERASEELHGDLRTTLGNVLAEVLAAGFNSLFFEAGPAFSQSLLDADLVDLLAIYSSKKQSALDLWGGAGLTNSVSLQVSSHTTERPQLSGFELIEQADLVTDHFFLYRRTRDG